MSKDNERISCGVCHAYLFEEDDVVYCPVCGAPHHRDCYKSLGHCAFSDAHGTDKEYRRPESESREKHTENKSGVICEICGAVYDSEEPNCPECSAPNYRSMGGAFANLDFLGGVPAETDLGKGVKAEEARRFVFSNTRRYIPRFAEINVGKKAGWNWFAFLFPCGWFLSRKMYKAGTVAGILSICFSMLSVPFHIAVSHYDMSSFTGYSELFRAVLTDASKTGPSILALFAAGLVLQTALRFVCAISGDKIYRDYAIETISRIKRESDDIDYDYRKKGGASFLLLLLGFFAVQYIPGIIASLLI